MPDVLFDLDDYAPLTVKAMRCAACVGIGCARCDSIGRLGSSIWQGSACLARITSETTEREGGSSYPMPPCATCGEPVYLTVSGPWRHVERDYAHAATPDRENGSRS